MRDEIGNGPGVKTPGPFPILVALKLTPDACLVILEQNTREEVLFLLLGK